MLDMKSKLLTVEETLKIAGISRYTLYRDSKNGKIEAINFGVNVRFREDDVMRYAEEKKNSVFVNYYKNKKERDKTNE